MPVAPRPLQERFWAKVKVLPNGCQIWTGATSVSRSGTRYGYIQEGGRGSKVLRVHRLALVWAVGEPPTPQHEAGHRCPGGANSLCVNEGHLAWVTRVENEQDKKQAPYEREPGEEG